jgi:hypothetical protein
LFFCFFLFSYFYFVINFFCFYFKFKYSSITNIKCTILKKTQHKIHDLLYLYIKYLFSQMKCTTKIISMRCILLYLFIGHLVNLILLIEYAQRKENQIISKGSIILKHLVISIFILYFFSYTNFGLYTTEGISGLAHRTVRCATGQCPVNHRTCPVHQRTPAPNSPPSGSSKALAL